jgi:nucleotide-binding universal stress UspA family protein
MCGVGRYKIGALMLSSPTMPGDRCRRHDVGRNTSKRERVMVGGAMQSKVVVGVDGSAASDAAIHWAAHEAAMRGLPIKLINVVAPTLFSSAMAPNDTITQGQEDQARQIIDQARRVVDEVPGEKPGEIHTEVRYASVVPTLVDASNDAQMIVVGRSGLSAWGPDVLGSVTSGLLHHAHCPVAVAHAPESAQDEIREDAPILVGIDGSAASGAAVALAFDEALHRGVPLVALHAWSDVAVFPILGMDWRTYRDEGDEVLGERLAGWQERYPEVQVHRRLVCDVPARWLIDESKDAQLVVLGSRGRGGYAGMHLGSVTSAVLQSVRVPVIVARNGSHEFTDRKPPERASNVKDEIRHVSAWVDDELTKLEGAE